jgi:hypothetical protein
MCANFRFLFEQQTADIRVAFESSTMQRSALTEESKKKKRQQKRNFANLFS